MTQFSRRDLRLLYVLIGTSKDREVPRLQDMIRGMIAARAGEQEWGEKVYEIRLPLTQKRTILRGPKGKKRAEEVTRPIAPTLNQYGSMLTWQRAALYKLIDLRILAELHRWPRARLGGDVRRRGARVTRSSSSPVDEITCDVIGGKVPIDRLVQGGILGGDTRELLAREAVWTYAPPEKGSLLVEVFELLPAGVSSSTSISP